MKQPLGTVSPWARRRSHVCSQLWHLMSFLHLLDKFPCKRGKRHQEEVMHSGACSLRG